MSAQIRVTIEDLETGETETVEIADDYILICAGSCENTHTAVYPTKGTHVLTVKGMRGTQVSTRKGGDGAQAVPA